MNINEDIGRISKYLMYKEAFYGLFLSTLNKCISEDTDRAGVGKRGINCELIINPSFWGGLSDLVKEGLLKHELLHIAFGHISLRDSFSDHTLFNIAADIEVNQYIDPKAIGEDWVTIDCFDNLPKKAGTVEYYKLLDKKRECGDGDILSQLTVDANSWGQHPSWKAFADLTEAEKDLVKRQLGFQLKEVYEALKSRGLIPGEMEAYIKELYVQKPQIFDWKKWLRRYLEGANRYYTKKSRRKLNKRFYGLPAILVKPRSRILVAIDTSGSVSDRELLDFFSQIYYIWKSGSTVDILECDARLHPLYEYKGKFLGKVHGRGGTQFQPVIDYYNEHHREYGVLIYFTDGECPAPTRPYKPMLWVISSNASQGASDREFPWHRIQIPKAA